MYSRCVVDLQSITRVSFAVAAGGMSESDTMSIEAMDASSDLLKHMKPSDYSHIAGDEAVVQRLNERFGATKGIPLPFPIKDSGTVVWFTVHLNVVDWPLPMVVNLVKHVKFVVDPILHTARGCSTLEGSRYSSGILE
jgi:hypothetical protein